MLRSSSTPHCRLGVLRRLVLSTAALGAVTGLATVPSAAYAESGGPSARPALVSGDRLTVTVRGAGGTADGTYQLECRPPGGSHPDARRACGRLDRRTTSSRDPFAPVPPGTVCTMQYGGPATARVTGTWAGRPVDARFDRGNGCEIARWDALVPLLPDLRRPR